MRPTLLAPVALVLTVRIATAQAASGSRQPAALASSITPRAAVATLLDLDRAFSKTSSDLSMRAALDAMFASGIVAPYVRGEILKGKAAVLKALLQTPDSAAKLSWAPVNGGISADGLHGFTYGYLVAAHPDGRLVHSKYMAYWIREPRGWRVAAWKRRPMANAPLAAEAQAPVLPARLLNATPKPDVIARHYRTLVNAEAGFSALAGRVGLGRAFAEMGTKNAVNMGGPNDPFIVGARAISRSVAPAGGDQPAGITWRADTAIVASSGDLGITFGVIKPKQQDSVAPSSGAAFFTIWHRSSPLSPWRYIAE